MSAHICLEKTSLRFTIFDLFLTYPLIIMHGSRFTHLYGPPKVTDEGGSIKQDISWVPIGNDDEVSSTSGTTNAADSSAECSINNNCAELGLIGKCCPTNKGVMLECCS